MVTRDMKENERVTIEDNAVAIHEVFLSYCKAGFTEDQAMQLVIAHINGTSGGGQHESRHH